MKFRQLERWCRANIDSQWMMLKRSFSDLLDTMRMTMGPRRMCPRTFDLLRCVPRMIRDMSLRWFIAWNKHPMDYMSHGRMIPDQCVPTPSVREEISQHRTSDEMSPNTIEYIFTCVYIHQIYILMLIWEIWSKWPWKIRGHFDQHMVKHKEVNCPA